MTSFDVLVTGGTGYLGRHVVDLLVAQGRSVVSLSRRPVDGLPLAEARAGDLTDAAFASELLHEVRPRLILHLAGSLRTGDPRALLEDNVLATVRLVSAARSLDVPPRLVVASSSAVYGPSSGVIDEQSDVAPVTFYGITKVAQEQAANLLDADLPGGLAIARIFNLVGPDQSSDFVLGRVARRIAEAERGGPATISVRNTTTSRDFVDVRDAASALIRLGDAVDQAGIFNVASGITRSVGEAIDLLMARSPCALTLDTTEAAPDGGDVTTQTGDPGRLQGATGWSPTHSFEESLQALLDSWRARTVKEAT